MSGESATPRVPLARILVAGLPLFGLLAFVALVATDWIGPDLALAIDGNLYAANFILAVSTAAGQLVVFVNLNFYLNDINPSKAARGGVVPKGEVGIWTYHVLRCSAFGIGAYFLLIGVTLLGLGKKGYWLFSLDTFAWLSRIVTIILFAVFFWVDHVLAKSWTKVETSSSSAREKTRARRNRDLARFSKYLIDVPAIAVTVSSWAVVSCLRSSRFVAQVAESYVSGNVWGAPLSQADLELFVNGIDTGVVVATMLLSQLTFTWLLIEFGGTNDDESQSGAVTPVGDT